MRLLLLVATLLFAIIPATYSTEDAKQEASTTVEVSLEVTVVALYPDLQGASLKEDDVLRQLNGLVLRNGLKNADGETALLAPETVLGIVPTDAAQSLWRDVGRRGETVTVKGAVDLQRLQVRVESFTVIEETDWLKDLQEPGGISGKKKL